MADIGIKELQKPTLEDLLKKEINYEVPFFQREYSWGKDNWSEFLEDINRAKEKEGHFFGFMTFKEEGDGKFYIIEGQQRLTTVTILVSVIRDMFYSLNIDKWRELDEKYIVSKDSLSVDSISIRKLTLSELNKAFFEHIQKVDKPEEKIKKIKSKINNNSNKLIFECYNYFLQELTDRIKQLVDIKDKIKILLEDILSTVLKKFVVISTEVKDNHVAFNMFQTLNARALDLTITDLLKIYLFDKVGDSWEEIKEKWDEMKGILSFVNMNNFLRHYWLSNYKVVKENDLLKEVEIKVKTKPEVFKFVDNIKEEAEIYEALLNPTDNEDYWGNKEVVRLLDELQLLSTYMPLPLLMATQKLQLKEFIKSIQSCINFTFRYITIAEREKKVYEKIFSELAIDVRRGNIKDSKEIIKRLSKENPDDETFKKIFTNKEIKTKKIAKYILEKFEYHLSGDQEKIDEKITLEHILPLNLDEEWQKYLEINRMEKNDWVYRIGNLTLLLGKINESAQNKFFTKKRDEFYSKMTKLKINDELKNIQSWTGKDIETRQQHLADISTKIWKLG